MSERALSHPDEVAALMGAAQPDARLIQARFRESLDAYVQHRYQPGGFLTAVLSNDLFEAFGRGDAAAIVNLPHIVSYIYNELPSGCHGSPERVRAWLREGGAS